MIGPFELLVAGISILIAIVRERRRRSHDPVLPVRWVSDVFGYFSAINLVTLGLAGLTEGHLFLGSRLPTVDELLAQTYPLMPIAALSCARSIWPSKD